MFKNEVHRRYKVISSEADLYFHVSDHPETPKVPDTKHAEIRGVFLGIKAEKYHKESFDWSKKYYWSASLRPSVKLYDIESNWVASTFYSILKKEGIPVEAILEFVENAKDSESQYHWDSIQKSENRKEGLHSFLENSPQAGYIMLQNYFNDGKRLTKIFKNMGYDGIYDRTGDHIYDLGDITPEPQLIIFNPSDIVWGERQANVPGLVKII